jgi:hypothetical protein
MKRLSNKDCKTVLEFVFAGPWDHLAVENLLFREPSTSNPDRGSASLDLCTPRDILLITVLDRS